MAKKNDHVESYKEFVKKLAESQKPITKSSQFENLAKCQTNLTSEAQVAKCRIRSKRKSRQVPDQASQFSQGHKLAEILKVNGKFWVESRLVHQIFLHIPLLSGARCARVVTCRCFSAFTAQHERLFENGGNLSASF